MRISKKILAIALSILMAVSMMPFTVFAATTTVNSVSDFETAVAAATAGDTIQLGANLDFTSDSKYAANSYTSSESYVDISGLTIDLGGYTITNNTAGLKFSGSDCVIKNGKFVGVADSPTRRYGLALWSYEAYVDGSNDSIPTGTVYEQNVVLEDLEVDGGINVLGHRNVVLRDCNVYGNSYYALYLNFASDATIESGEYTAANTKANGIVACYDATSLASEYATKIDITGGSFTVAKTDLVLASSGPVEISGGTYKNANDTAYTVPAKYLAEGAVEDANGEVTQYVAEVNGVKYDTFEKALAAISTVTTATHSNAKDPTYQYKTYVANGTIKLLADTTSNGVIIGSGSNLTIDFNGKTLDITDKPVGSNGTETIGMQLLKDSDITFENGTLTSTADSSKKIVRLIQNYADLTLDNMTVGMKGNFYDQMTMSNCNGDITITGSTVSAPDFTWLGYTDEQAAESLGAVAMSVGTFSTYTGVEVTVTDSNIKGNVNIDNTGANGTAALTLDGGEVTGDIVDKSMNNSTVTNNGSTVGGIPEGYEWNASNVLAPIADVFNLDIEDSINMNMYINTEAYADDATIEVTYSTPELNDKTAKTTDTISASTLPRDSQNRVKLTVNAAPAQITDDVVIKVKSGNQVVHTVTTSVMAYCKEIIAKSNNAELVKLAETMLDYGKAANRSFKYTEPSRFNYNNGEDYYNFYYGNVDDTAVLDKTGNNGVFASYSYIATTVPALRLYTNLSESQCGNADGVVTKATITNVTKGTTTKVAPVVVDLGDDNKVVAIDITGILAEDLADVYTVEYKGSTIKLNAIQFAKAVKDTDRVDFGRAMFNYYVAANAYFK